MLVLALLAMAPVRHRTFTITPIPLPEGRKVSVYDLNDKGEICGIVEQKGPAVVFRSGVGKKPEVMDFPGGFSWTDQSIAHDGTVFAVRRSSDGPKLYRWGPGRRVSTEAMPKPMDIWSPNSSGEYLYKEDHTEQGTMYLHRADRSVPLSMPAGYRYTTTMLTDSGVSLGSIYGPKTGMLLAVWDRNGNPALFPFAKYNRIEPVDANEKGQVVGRLESGGHDPIKSPFVFDHGSLRRLSPPAEIDARDSWALAVNNRGQILCQTGGGAYWLTDGKSDKVLKNMANKPGYHPALLNNKGQVLFVTDQESPKEAFLVSLKPG